MTTESWPPLRETILSYKPAILSGASNRRLVMRAARDADTAGIVALVSQVWSEYPGKTLVPARDMPELLAPATNYAACRGAFWVVEAGAEIIATVACKPSEADGVFELQKLYVAQAARRNGIGTSLCDLVEREARARGAQAIELWSDIKLLDAHRRYERLGYRRGEALRMLGDASRTVQYYYCKMLQPAQSRVPDPWAVDVVSAPRPIRATTPPATGAVVVRERFTTKPTPRKATKVVRG